MPDKDENRMHGSPIPKEANDGRMLPSPIPSGDQPQQAPEPKHYPPGFLAINMIKTEPHAVQMALDAATVEPPPAQPTAVANVDDPTSGNPQNYGTGRPGAFLHPDDEVRGPPAVAGGPEAVTPGSPNAPPSRHPPGPNNPDNPPNPRHDDKDKK